MSKIKSVASKWQRRNRDRLADSGKPFNPLAAVARPQVHSLAEVVPGGLGLPLINCYSDHLDYHYLDGKNHLKITVQWAR
jgi:anti-sigma regulatory factor (Ser/Thr protein kinase)